MDTLVLVALLIFVLTLGILFWLSMARRPECPPPRECPDCPPQRVCPTRPELCQEVIQENNYLKDMVRYLTLILKRYEAEKELYTLSHGYAQVYNSPKMEYIKKELRRMLKYVKSDVQRKQFFEKHLNNVIE